MTTAAAPAPDEKADPRCKGCHGRGPAPAFTMAFQPIAALRPGQPPAIWGYEALVRGEAGEGAAFVLDHDQRRGTVLGNGAAVLRVCGGGQQRRSRGDEDAVHGMGLRAEGSEAPGPSTRVRCWWTLRR